MTEADLISLLLEKEDSAFQLYRRFFREYGIDLYMKEEEARKFAAAALQNGTGARGLRSELDRCMEPLLLKLAALECRLVDEIIDNDIPRETRQVILRPPENLH